MKKVNVTNLIPGMVTAEDVFTYNNQLIVQKGVILTDKTITRLEFYSIISIRIEEDYPSSTPLSNHLTQGLSDEELRAVAFSEDWSYSTLIKSTPEFLAFKQNFDHLLEDFKLYFNDIINKNIAIDAVGVLRQTVSLLITTSGHINYFHMLHCMRDYDDTTFSHSLNVALLCNILAQWLSFSQEEINMATLCGLFHDIGKLAIPDDIIRKPSKLTDAEYQIIKTHTLEGYSILKDQDLSIHIKNAALMHHERYDGSGYPMGINEEKIDKYAQLVAVVDVYEAMTAARVYRGPLCPFKVIEIFEKEGLQKYNTRYVLTFLENAVLTYMNNRVRLSNGVEGDIVFINKDNLSRPLIRFRDNFIDLEKHPELHIEAII